MQNDEKNMKEGSFLKKKLVIYGFAIISLFGGFLFLNKSITGNVILNKQHEINLISLIGILLIVCAAVLFAYSIKKR